MVWGTKNWKTWLVVSGFLLAALLGFSVAYSDYGDYYYGSKSLFIIPADECTQCYDYFPTPEPEVYCCTEGLPGLNNSVCYKTYTADECRNNGGYIVNCMDEDTNFDPPPQACIPEQPYRNFDAGKNWNPNDPFFQNLIENIHRAGVYKNKYLEGVYDCKNYTIDLHRNLSALGYNVTITLYRVSDTDWPFASRASHALLDFHYNDSIYFIEPQANETMKFFKNLDRDGDGIIKSHPSMWWRWDFCPIEKFGNLLFENYMYENLTDARAHGAPI